MNQIFFYASKILWLAISPDHLLVLLLLAGLFFFVKKATKRAALLLSFCTAAILFITFFPVGHWLLYPLETRFEVLKKLPDKLDGIIVLAGAENISTAVSWEQVEFNGSAERLLAFIRLINTYPEARHVFVGGTGSLTRQHDKSEHVIRQLFEELNLDLNKIIFESNSKNTYENAVFSFEQLRPQKDEQWLLITSASHMPRSVGVFRNAGWKILPFPVDHTVRKHLFFRMTFDFSGNLRMLKKAAKEWIGLGMYHLTGKTDQLFPGP